MWWMRLHACHISTSMRAVASARHAARAHHGCGLWWRGWRSATRSWRKLTCCRRWQSRSRATRFVHWETPPRGPCKDWSGISDLSSSAAYLSAPLRRKMRCKLRMDEEEEITFTNSCKSEHNTTAARGRQLGLPFCDSSNLAARWGLSDSGL